MIDKLIQMKGYEFDDNDSISYTQTPLRTGSFLVYIKLPQVLRSAISNTSEVEDLLITSVKSIDLPNTSILYEPLHNGRQLMTNIPMAREETQDITIRFYETSDCDVTSIFEMWMSALSDPIHHTPIWAKPFGKSYFDLVKTTITVYIFDPTILKKLSSSLILKLYGATVETLDKAGFNTDYESHDVAQIGVTFKVDRVIPLTKSIAQLYGLQDVFVKTEEALFATLQQAQRQAYQSYAKQLKELMDKLSQVTEYGGVTS